jgi:hypothetical protein
MVSESIAQSIEAGESLAGMKRRIQESFSTTTPSGDTMTNYRAMMIARTESGRATGRGEIAGWEATGVVKGRRWLVSPDPCQFCEAANLKFGTEVTPIDQPYLKVGDTLAGTMGGVMAVDFSDVDSPTELHPQCRCSQVPVVGGKS